MTNVQIFFLSFYTANLAILMYRNIAISLEWQMGRWFALENSRLKKIATLFLMGSIIVAFFFIKWYFVFIGLLVGFVLILIISSFFKTYTQYLSLLMLVASWSFLFFKWYYVLGVVIVVWNLGSLVGRSLMKPNINY